MPSAKIPTSPNRKQSPLDRTKSANSESTLFQITDAEIARDVNRTLAWIIPGHRISVTVLDGLVTLDGEVDTNEEQADAEKTVRDLYGVARVDSDIRVSGSRVAQEVRRSLFAALGRHAERAGKHIDVRVSNGVATLTGAVDSSATKERILGATRGTPGVCFVNDQIRIAP